jgi:hypothetical protein
MRPPAINLNKRKSDGAVISGDETAEGIKKPKMFITNTHEQCTKSERKQGGVDGWQKSVRSKNTHTKAATAHIDAQPGRNK